MSLPDTYRNSYALMQYIGSYYRYSNTTVHRPCARAEVQLYQIRGTRAADAVALASCGVYVRNGAQCAQAALERIGSLSYGLGARLPRRLVRGGA